jgi:hypothetical protein
MIEKRKEPRYPIPEMYQKHIKLKIKKGSDEFTPAKVLDVSLGGIKIGGDQIKLMVGSVIDCSIYIPRFLPGEAHFSAKVHYCMEDEGEKYYFIGAEAVQSSQESWVKIFFRVHDFISQEIRGNSENLPA